MIARSAILVALALVSQPRSGPLFDFYPTSASSTVLSTRIGPSLTLNSITVATPDWEYDGVNGSASAWTATYGTNLTKVEVGANITSSVDTPLTSSDTGVTFADADYQQETSATWAPGTKDIVIKAVFCSGALAASDTIVSSYDAANTGVELLTTSTGILRVIVGDGTGIVQADSAAGAIAARTWYNVACYLDRSASGACYVNGVAQTATAISGKASSITATGKLTIGARSSGANNADHTVVYAAAWSSAAWLDTHLQASDAMAFAQKVEGFYPISSQGSPVATVKTRSTTSLLEKRTAGVSSYFRVGAAWMRTIVDSVGTGGFIERARSQLMLQSDDIATSWTKVDAGDTHSLNAVADPLIDGGSDADGIVGANASNVEHGVTQVANNGGNLTAARYTQSAMFKAGVLTFAYLSDDTVANATGYFNISTCAAATIGAGASNSFAVSLGGGWCRVGISWTGTVAAHTLRYSCAEADSDKVYAGDGASVLCYQRARQLILGAFLGSPVPSTTAVVANSGDAVNFTSTGNLNAAAGSVVCQYRLPGSSEGSDTNDIVSINDATANEKLSLVLNGEHQLFQATVGGVTQANISDAATDVVTAATITGAIDWRTNRFVNYTAGAIDGTVDTVATTPTITRIAIGANTSNTPSADAVIVRCQVFQSPEHAVLR